MNSIFCLSPIDGRYKDKVGNLRNLLSEYGLIYFRTHVEIEWLKHLSEQKELHEIPKISENSLTFLDDIINNFSEEDAQAVKDIEKTTNHDVKAIEYFLKNKISINKELSKMEEFIHFACTSEDINNLSYGLMLKKSVKEVLIPELITITSSIKDLAKNFRHQAMLSRTHGQSASPTTVGKEMANVVHRLERQIKTLKNTQFLGKINGAVGNFNAHVAAYPALDWPNIAKSFVEKLGLDYNPLTTQIEPHDYIAECFNCIALINTILIDFSRDIWGYISLNYFKQNPIAGEIGSSTMPHKINPIQFENAEGNMGISSALLIFYFH
jgi:adenylosuccinate lyase